MNKHITLLICVLTLFLFGCATQRKTPDELGLEALHTLGFAELLKIVVKRDCLKPLLANHPLCPKIDRIPDDYIERLKVPYFNQFVSAASAQAIVRFYSSPEGKRISEKLMAGIRTNTVPEFSSDESAQLSAFHESTAGQESFRSANDTESSVAIFKALIAYQPD